MNSTDIALQDLSAGLKQGRLALALAQREIRTRFSRTTLGPLWITLAQAVWISGMALVFSQVFKQEVRHYLFFLAAGMPVWTLISNLVNESTTTFVNSRGVFEQFLAPWSVQVLRRLLVNAYIFAQHMIVWVAVLVFTGQAISPVMLLALPGLAILLLGGWGALTLLGVLGARYRDLQPALTAAMSFMFVLTPVFWDAKLLSGNRPFITHANPFFHYLTIVRDPLIGRAGDPYSWIFCIVCSVVLTGLGALAFTMQRKSLFNWL